MISSDLSTFSNRMVIEDSSSGQRRIIASIDLPGHGVQPNTSSQKTSWNFKKTNWKLSTKLIEEIKLITIPNCPRREAVTKFRLLTGRDCPGKHSHRIRNFDQPNCLQTSDAR
ncbi:hypothetical protein TNCT_546191 [Trichonephila clavata]|uniref:Uncharacterized protein n=1 Tax=Trichonephila clavata TaxID=2740835 RepID=A0A8X6J9R6_TRICU|nr:hypothetical protein TNCT_546191 [Trichonephila clavata]